MIFEVPSKPFCDSMEIAAGGCLCLEEVVSSDGKDGMAEKFVDLIGDGQQKKH